MIDVLAFAALAGILYGLVRFLERYRLPEYVDLGDLVREQAQRRYRHTHVPTGTVRVYSRSNRQSIPQEISTRPQARATRSIGDYP